MSDGVVITGGRSKFVPELVSLFSSQGTPIHLITKSSELNYSNPLVQHYKADLLQPLNLQLTPKVLIHLAAQVPYNSSKKISQQNILAENTLSLLNVMNFCIAQNVQQLILVSSTDVYPLYSNTVITENTKTDPKGVYGCSKLACERIALTYSNLYPIHATILRLGPIYGSGMDSNLSVAKLLRSTEKGEKISLYNADNIPSLLKTEEASRAIFNAVGSKTGIINIAGKPKSLQHFFEDRYKELKLTPQIEITSHSDNPIRMVFDLSKAQTLLNWRPE